MSVEMVEVSVKAAAPARPAGVLQQNRVFLDFFWDLAKPDQEVRLKAIEDLIKYLKTNNKVSHSEISVCHWDVETQHGYLMKLGRKQQQEQLWYLFVAVY